MDVEQDEEHAPPPVPIKTYRWEEVRRQRLAGVYPWTHVVKGPYSEKAFQEERDHEYEPISPMAQPVPPPVVKVTDMENEETKSRGSENSNDDNHDHHYLQIPLDDDLVDKGENEDERNKEEDEARGGDDDDDDISTQELQNRMEERYFAATPTTTESRTDCEINTSQVDSSGLDELPLKTEARQANEVRGIQSRIRSQAGRLRQKIRNISRPKINLPERSKFKLPERPKINLPERPKLKLPERPKLKLPERPKFNFPQRPKISMPSFNFGKTKTSSIRRPLRDRTQVQSDQSSSTGSKKNIFDTFRTYPRIFKKKRAGLDVKGGRALTPPPRMEIESSPPSTPASRKNNFARQWTERYKDIKFADDESQSEKQKSYDEDVEDDSAPFRDTEFTGAIRLEEPVCKPIKAESSGSIPGSDKEHRSSGSSSDRLRAGVIEEIDSDEFFLREKGLSREDVDVSRYLSLEIRDAFRSPKNALARLDTELYDDEDYDFEPPIRRTPNEPIRRSMEAMRRESIEPMRMTPDPEPEAEIESEPELEPEPARPTRTRSLKKRSTRSYSEDINADTQFNTFPPSRPNRGRKHSVQSKQSVGTDELNDMDIDDKENIPEDIIRQPSIPSLAVTDTTKDTSPTRYIDESSEALNWQQDHQPPLPPKRRKSSSKDRRDNDSLNNDRYENEKWMEIDDVQTMVPGEITALQLEATNDAAILSGYYDSPPLPPNRKLRSRGTSLADEDRTSRGAESLISETPQDEEILQEIDINRVRPIYDDYAVVEKPSNEAKHQQTSLPRPPRPPQPNRRKKTAAQITALKNHGINFFFTYPRRAIKSLQKEMPVRPIRNYSTIGPARPPRRNRVFREPVYVESEIIPLKDESEQGDFDLKPSEVEEKLESIEIESTQVINTKELTLTPDEVQETRDLQSGDVIEKMKGRPLPPPPRPPRKNKDDSISRHDEDFRDEKNDIQVTDLDDPDDEEIVVQRINICVTPDLPENIKEQNLLSDDIQASTLSDSMHLPTVIDKAVVVEPPVKVERKRKSISQTSTAPLIQEPPIKPEETCVSTQTDPLPEGFLEEQQQTIGELPKARIPEPIEKVKHIETVIEKQVIVLPSPDSEVQVLKTQKLQVSELDVDKLNVNELQAQKIIVSEIDGVTMQISEVSSKSGHLVINGIELPPSFLENLTQPSLATATHEQTQSSTQTAPPPVTVDSQTNTTPTVAIPEPLSQLDVSQTSSPTPSIVVESPQSTQTPVFISSYVPSSTIPHQRSPQQTRAHVPTTQQLDSEEDMCLMPSRRRRHHSHKHSNRYSSDEEEEEDYSKHYTVARRHQPREQTAAELARQLINIWQDSFLRGVNHVIDGINVAFPEGEKRKDAQTAACIILVLIAGLIMLGFGQERTVHHHHWDFIPPHP